MTIEILKYGQGKQIFFLYMYKHLDNLCCNSLFILGAASLNDDIHLQEIIKIVTLA